MICIDTVHLALAQTRVAYFRWYLSHLEHIDDHMLHTRWLLWGSNLGPFDSEARPLSTRQSGHIQFIEDQ